LQLGQFVAGNDLENQSGDWFAAAKRAAARSHDHRAVRQPASDPRFRVLAAANTQLWDLQLINQSNNAIVPFTIIGSDGGYLPAPQVVSDVQIGITERADLLVDFSQFAAGTKIQMNNNYVLSGGSDFPTLGTVMQFTVQAGAAVPPPVLSPSLFPSRAVLTADAPTRFKVLRIFDDLRPDGDTCSDPALVNCNQRTIDVRAC